MQRRFASINTFGLATRWSDGYRDVLMLRDAASLAYCPGCNKVYWLEDAKKLGVVPPSESQAEHSSGWVARIFRKTVRNCSEEQRAKVDVRDLDFVDYHEPPRPADLLLAMLREEWTTPERELYLRTQLWWIGNHQQRNRRTVSPMTDEQANLNMRRLLALHQNASAAVSQICTVGELLRQLGQFDEAVAILNPTSESDASAILAAARRGETGVFVLETY